MLHFGTKATYELKTSFLYSQVDLEFVANGTRATRMSYVRTYEGAISQNAYKTGGGGRRGPPPPEAHLGFFGGKKIGGSFLSRHRGRNIARVKMLDN